MLATLQRPYLLPFIECLLTSLFIASIDSIIIGVLNFGVMQDHIFFDGEAFSLMAPLNMDPKVSAKRPSHPPQPHPLLTFALPLAPYFVPSGRLWQSIFFGRFTLFDGFNGETAPCSMGLQTFSLRGVV